MRLRNLTAAVRGVISRYRKAVGLQIEAFWKRNSLVLVGAAGVIGMAKYGFFALSSAIVAFAGLYLRSRFTINPDKVYRIAMKRLNTNAGILEGSERKGLVSVEVKKKKGQYDMKLLAVDIPMATGPDQRIFLIGDEEEYRVGGGLINELRDPPVVKAMAATKEFEDRDKREDEEDAERELQEAERKRREETEKLEKGSS
ncbi:hypothetical protein Acr_02g0002710 [Actinidia rufa]|uniref:Transmembrane protein n=1 Tax=Actinidia rufa TaxID=165716 RepID=A0A7J0E6A5_9ERIC|nr:hypothetical protein Acr_02g0002710 [Actinidia rufa]